MSIVRRIGSPVRKPLTEEWGGKGKNLLEMGVGDFVQIPDGFVVSTQLYDDFQQKMEVETGIQIDQVVQSQEISRREKSELIQDAISSVELPRSFEEDIHQVIDSLDEPLIARSSAAREDGDENSFAGRLESFPHLSSQEVYGGIKDVFRSAYDEKAMKYYEENGMLNPGSVGVVVQEMVEGDVGGVMYSTNPRDPETIYIEAAPDSAETVVDGGAVDSIEVQDEVRSQFTYRRSGQEIEDNEEHILDSDEIRMLAETGKDIEDFYGQTMDIEFVLNRDEGVYIVQARPKTGNNFDDALFDLSDVDEERLIGQTDIVAGEGRYTGPALVIDDAVPNPRDNGLGYEMRGEQSLEDLDQELENYILVSPTLNPNIEVRAEGAEAIVAYESGVASHAANVADEREIPMIGATAIETSYDDNGSIAIDQGTTATVEVNGQEGIFYEGDFDG